MSRLFSLPPPISPNFATPFHARFSSSTDYIVALDLGKRRDPAAFVVLQRQSLDPAKFTDPYGFYVQHIEEIPLQTPYPDIVRHATEIVTTEPLAGCCTFVIDRTGVGEVVYDYVMETPTLSDIVWTIWFTSGSKTTQDGVHFKVPKATLVDTLLILMQKGLIKCSDKLLNWNNLRREMLTFQLKQTKADNQIMEAGKESEHDDIPMALCIGTWLGLQIPQEFSSQLSGGFRPYRMNEGNTIRGVSPLGSQDGMGGGEYTRPMRIVQ